MTLDLVTSSFSSSLNYNKSLVYNRNSLHCSLFPRFTLYFYIQTIFIISRSFQTMSSFFCKALHQQYFCKIFSIPKSFMKMLISVKLSKGISPHPFTPFNSFSFNANHYLHLERSFLSFHFLHVDQ